MIVRIQYCVDGTGGVESKWAVYVAPSHLTIQNLFNRIHAGKLLLFGLFQNMVCTSGMYLFQGIPICTPCFKTIVFVLKKFMVLRLLHLLIPRAIFTKLTKIC